MSEEQPQCILCLETATEVCSVAVYRGEELLTEQTGTGRYQHAEQLHPFIRDALQGAGLEKEELDAIAVSLGPGSYTGLRIGLSAAQGLSFGLDISLWGIPTLEALATACLEQYDEARFVAPMIDARRMEVYTAVYDRSMDEVEQARALVLENESLESFRTKNHPLYVCGNGCSKWKEQHPECVVWCEELICSARHLIPSVQKYRAVRREIAPDQLKPIYLKSPNITRPQQTSD